MVVDVNSSNDWPEARMQTHKPQWSQIEPSLTGLVLEQASFECVHPMHIEGGRVEFKDVGFLGVPHKHSIATGLVDYGE